jgi:2-amino-4-hydroxy-6-hydroxymethyldihydropteridine diphosphokinase
MSKVYLSIGSNKGNRSVLINKAIDEIEKKVGIIISRSSIYQSKSWGFDSNDFYNLCLLIDTDIMPKSLLINLKKIEKSMGREDIDGSYSDRFIDIDILFYDNITTDSEDLKIPHPKIEIRKFVLVPMLEIADDYVHPILNKTIKELYNDCSDQDIPLKII